MKKNEIFETEITDMNLFGNGVSHIDGQAVFVQRGVTGDRARIKIIKVASDYAVARIEEILYPSPYRIEPTCPVYKRCGGCCFGHIDYAYELELKARAVETALRKAGIRAEREKILFGRPENYRNKVIYPVAPGAVAGFYARKSHDVVAFEECELQKKEFVPIIRDLTAFLAENRIPVYDEKTRRGLVRNIFLRRGEISGEIAVCLVVTSSAFPKKKELVDRLKRHEAIKSILLSINPKDTNVVLGEREEILFGDGTIKDVLCSLTFCISPRSFYQINHDVAEAVYRRAAEYCGDTGGKKILDLFCGIGTVGCTVAAINGRKEAELTGIEVVPEAVENARQNAERNGFRTVRFDCGDANLECVDDADIILIDPPRKGCAGELIRKIGASRAERVVYVSCNPDTLARDCAEMAKCGWKIEKYTPADMFPRTGHVETVTLITRA